MTTATPVGTLVAVVGGDPSTLFVAQLGGNLDASVLPSPEVIGVVVAGYALLLLTSGAVVGRTLAFIGVGDTEPSREARDVGLVIGKCENVLVATFVLVDAFTALSIVFAAKSIVRREDIRKNSRYYLAGTLVNFTYSVVVAGLVRVAAVLVSVTRPRRRPRSPSRRRSARCGGCGPSRRRPRSRR